jgi:hypothetical protein
MATLSPQDDRDWDAAEYLRTQVHKAVHYESPLTFLEYLKIAPPIAKQGQAKDCVAHALVGIAELFARREKGMHVDLSPGFLFKVGRPEEQKDGMYIRQALKVLHKRGVCTSELYPYRGRNKDPWPRDAAFENAHQFRVANYARINSLQTAKECLVDFGPLIVVFPVYDKNSPFFWQNTLGPQPPPPLHAVSLFGWTAEGFVIRNSWGEEWLNNGYGIYPFSHWGMHREMWSIVDVIIRMKDLDPFEDPPEEPLPQNEDDKRKWGCCTLC